MHLSQYLLWQLAVLAATDEAYRVQALALQDIEQTEMGKTK
jgi:hypothetical protein